MTLPRKLLLGLAIVLLVLAGFVAYAWHGDPSDKPPSVSEGVNPQLPDPRTRLFPSVVLEKPLGWANGAAPTPAPGLAVARFADGLDHPRTLLALPNGDVLVAETNAPPGASPGGITGLFMKLFQKLVGADTPSPNRIVLLRDADGDGRAEQRFVLRAADMRSPSGMAWVAGTLYIADHDAVLAFPFTPGATALTGPPRKLASLPSAGQHWMRNLIASPDGKTLYVAVGSATNIADNGIAAEQGRAGIWEIDLATGHKRQYAGGMRNPNGMGWNPATGELWALVQERDMLGPDLVPDYLTNVPVGAQYGWPWVYWRRNLDDRVKDPMPEFMIDYTRKPEYAMGAHSAVLGLAFAGGGNRMGPGFANGAFVARHGSWNRKPPVGYDVVFVPFDANGNPVGLPKPVLTGFLGDRDRGGAHGRPVWLAWDKGGGLLVSDDTGGVIWRVIAPGAAPAAAPKPVVTGHMPPQRELKGDPAALEASWKKGGTYVEVPK